MSAIGYRGVSVKREVVDRVESLVEHHPELGFSSLADFVTKAIVEKLQDFERRSR